MVMQEGDMLVQHVGIVTQVPGCQSPDRCSNCMWDLSVLDDFQRLYRLHPSYKYNRYNYFTLVNSHTLARMNYVKYAKVASNGCMRMYDL